MGGSNRGTCRESGTGGRPGPLYPLGFTLPRSMVLFLSYAGIYRGRSALSNCLARPQACRRSSRSNSRNASKSPASLPAGATSHTFSSCSSRASQSADLSS